MRRRLLTTLVPALAVLAAIAIAVSIGVRTSDASARAQTPEALVVALSLPTPGLQVGSVRNGNVALARGLEVELARAIAHSLGRQTVRFVNRPRASLLGPGTKTWDLALAQVTAAERRSASIDLSAPYLQGGQAILLRRGASPPSSSRDLQRLQLCAQRRAEGSSATRRFRPSKPILLVDGNDALLRLVQTGRCDGALVDATQLGLLVDGQASRFSPARFRLDELSYSVALPAGSELLPDVDRAVHRLAARGTLHRLAITWLGLDPAGLRVLGSSDTRRVATADGHR